MMSVVKNKPSNDKIRNLKGFIRGYAASPHGQRVVNRQFGMMHRGDKPAVWQNPALAHALVEAANV